MVLDPAQLAVGRDGLAEEEVLDVAARWRGGRLDEVAQDQTDDADDDEQHRPIERAHVQRAACTITTGGKG